MGGPASGAPGVADQVRDARERSASLRIVGAGLWLDAGRPCDVVERLEMNAMSGIVAYEPGDFTMTALAGTTLAEIHTATSLHKQWLTLDPHGSANGTLGATVATASSGPLASAYGTPRDHVLGCEFVSGAGDIVRAGGRVVKNVAGFDLVRLVTGAWGSLGALTEITVRLRARPDVDRTVAVTIAADSHAMAAEAARRWLRAGEHSPLAAELVSPALAMALRLDSGSSLLVRLGGNPTFARAAADAVATLGITRDLPDSVWRDLPGAEMPGAVVVRTSAVPTRIGELWQRGVDVAEACGGYAHATVSRGVVRVVLPGDSSAGSNALSQLHADGVTLIGERMPASLWGMIARARTSDALSGRVRRAFDPDGILNPGIMGHP